MGEPAESHGGRPAAGVGHYLRDLVYGANDGVITTLAIVAGVEGAGLPPLAAVALGLANLVADGISMGASNYLGLKSELEQAGTPVAAERPLRHGGATLLAFIAAGGVPLLAYGLPMPGEWRVVVAALLGAATLVAVGAARAPYVRRSGVRAGVEMLLVGAAAAAAAYLVGFAVRGALL